MTVPPKTEIHPPTLAISASEPPKPAGTLPPSPLPPLASPPPPPTAPRPKRTPMKSIAIGLSIVLAVASGILGYLFFQKGGFSVVNKAAEGDECEYPESCPGGGIRKCFGVITNGSCVYDGHRPCEECKACGNGSCDYGEGCDNCPSDCCSGQNCTPTINYSGFDALCFKGGTASVSITACLPDGCPLDGATVNYQRVVAKCEEVGCGGTCGSSPSTAQVIIPAGQKCRTEEVSCSPEDQCGTCQVDINDYGERVWNDAGCSSPTATPTPTASVSPTPTPTAIASPTPTPTGPVGCDCTRVIVTKLITQGEETMESEDLSALSAGDRIRILINFSGTAEDVAVRIIKDGQKTDLVAGSPQANSKSFEYVIPEAGEYQIQAFVKVDGQWK